jgi:hypothetical protein
LQIKSSLLTRSYFTEAVAAIYRSVFAWLERYFSFLATIGAYCREHLAWGSIVGATVSVPLCFPCLTAFGTAFGLISITLGLEKLLILNAEGEFTSTIGTFERLVLESHWMTSSLLYLVRVLVTQYLRKTEMLNSLCDNQYL